MNDAQALTRPFLVLAHVTHSKMKLFLTPGAACLNAQRKPEQTESKQCGAVYRTSMPFHWAAAPS